jgi:branched-chain amino acid transport system ATP-binding protein
VCDRVVVLDCGRVIAAGPPAVVAGHPAVDEAYLGIEVTAS